MSAGEGVPARAWLAVAGAVVVRPWLWATAVGQGRALARPGWWRRRPFLPLPDPDYLAFRMETMYGGAGARPPEADDVVAYLRWCRAARRSWGTLR